MYVLADAARFLTQSLLSLRKQQAVACLAFSCDWLAHKLLKIGAAIKHQPVSAPSDQSGAKSSGLTRAGDPDRRTSAANDVAVAPAEKLRQIARKLSQLADDSLLCLRLEVSTSHELMIGLRGIWICVCSIVTASFNPIFDLTRLGSPIVSLRYTCW